MPEQAGDNGQGNGVHRRLAGYSVAEVVQADTLDASLTTNPVPERQLVALGPGRVTDRRE